MKSQIQSKTAIYLRVGSWSPGWQSLVLVGNVFSESVLGLPKERSHVSGGSTRTGLKWTIFLGKNKEWVRLLGTTVGLVLAPQALCAILNLELNRPFLDTWWVDYSFSLIKWALIYEALFCGVLSIFRFQKSFFIPGRVVFLFATEKQFFLCNILWERRDLKTWFHKTRNLYSPR